MVRALLALLRWRCREDELFNGEFAVLDTDDSMIGMRWSSADQTATLSVGLDDISFCLEIDNKSTSVVVDTIDGLIALDGSRG